jgi:hypothetical protein
VIFAKNQGAPPSYKTLGETTSLLIDEEASQDT